MEEEKSVGGSEVCSNSYEYSWISSVHDASDAVESAVSVVKERMGFISPEDFLEKVEKVSAGLLAIKKKLREQK